MVNQESAVKKYIVILSDAERKQLTVLRRRAGRFLSFA